MLLQFLARIRWLSLALCILLAAGSWFCAYYWLSWEYSSGTTSRLYTFTENGGIAIVGFDSSFAPINNWQFERQIDERGVWRFRAAALSRTSNRSSATFIPLAPIAIVFAGLAIVGFKSFKHPLGHCRKCGYDLRSLPPGKCPECGDASVEQSPASTPSTSPSLPPSPVSKSA